MSTDTHSGGVAQNDGTNHKNLQTQIDSVDELTVNHVMNWCGKRYRIDAIGSDVSEVDGSHIKVTIHPDDSDRYSIEDENGHIEIHERIMVGASKDPTIKWYTFCPSDFPDN